MSLDAVALLKIPYADLCAAVDADVDATTTSAIASMATFVPVGTDATACLLDLPYASELEDLSTQAWSLIGPMMAHHDDERGILIVPNKNLEDADLSSYQAAVTYFGEVGQWAPNMEPADARDGADALAQMFAPGALPSAISNIQSQLAADPRMAQQLASGAGGEDLLAMAQQMLAHMTPEQQAQLEQMAKAMFGGLDPSALAALPGGGPPGLASILASSGGDDDSDGDDPEFGGADDPRPKKDR